MLVMARCKGMAPLHQVCILFFLLLLLLLTFNLLLFLFPSSSPPTIPILLHVLLLFYFSSPSSPKVCMARVASCLGSVGEVNRVALRWVGGVCRT